MLTGPHRTFYAHWSMQELLCSEVQVGPFFARWFKLDLLCSHVYAGPFSFSEVHAGPFYVQMSTLDLLCSEIHVGPIYTHRSALDLLCSDVNTGSLMFRSPRWKELHAGPFIIRGQHWTFYAHKCWTCYAQSKDEDKIRFV